MSVQHLPESYVMRHLPSLCHHQHMAKRFPLASFCSLFPQLKLKKPGDNTRLKTHHAQQLCVTFTSAGTLLSEVVCCSELQILPQMQLFHSIAALILSAELQLASATKSEHYWHTHKHTQAHTHTPLRLPLEMETVSIATFPSPVQRSNSSRSTEGVGGTKQQALFFSI